MLYLYIFCIILTAIISYLAGYLIAKSQNRKTTDTELFIALSDFRKSMDEYKTQSLIGVKEVKDAIADAQKLSRVLTTNQNLKGQFAEDCLEEVLSACYPDKNINYIKQFVTKNEDGAQIKPDYLVNLPNNKSILIDCKLNLDKFLEFKDEPAKKADFIKDLNSTINNLANKKYQTAQDLTQPDFILMYIPLEPVLTLIYTDKDFLSVVKNAADKNIVIVGNSCILTVIKLARLIWAKDSQEKNIDNIIALAQNIYDLAARHTNTLFEIKNILNDSMEKFNKEYEKMTKGSKLFKSIETLKDYGIQSSNKKEGRKLLEVKINSDFLN